MSRIGKKPVPVPKGVTVSVEGSTVRVKGPRGELTRLHPPGDAGRGRWGGGGRHRRPSLG